MEEPGPEGALEMCTVHAALVGGAMLRIWCYHLASKIRVLSRCPLDILLLARLGSHCLPLLSHSAGDSGSIASEKLC